MSTPKRQRQPDQARTPNSAGQPTISVRAERTAESLAAERQALTVRRAKLAGAVAVPVALLAGLLFFFQPFARPADGEQVSAVAPAAPAAQATTAPTATPAPTAAPAAQATAAPAAQATAAPVLAAPAAQPTAAPASAAIACDAIAGLPVYSGASCVKHDLDSDDGVMKAKNSYTSTAAADEVRRFYEAAFAKQGWALDEFDYTIDLGARRIKIHAETDQGASGVFTKLRLTEYGAPAGARSSCTAIEGLPAFPNAQCSDFDTDVDNGATKAENTYMTSASPEDVRRFYEDTLKQNGWAGQDFTYEVAQGQRRLQVDVEAKVEPSGAFTELKISEK